MANRELEDKWKKVLKWVPTFQQAIGAVALETGVTVPLTRLISHCGIETGYSGDPKSVSGNRTTCCDQYGDFVVGVDCSPDCRYHGLFQIYWHICQKVDWNKIYDPYYNSYLGAKYLACAYNECGTWRKASTKFFTGSCNFTGTVDDNTGTDDATYDHQMTQNMQELAQLGYEDLPDPKSKTPTPNGSTNTPTDTPNNGCAGNTVSIFGLTLCLDFGTKNDPVSTTLSNVFGEQLQSLVDNALPRIVLIVVGIILLAIAAYAVLN
jgi:hypothetical protein